MFILENTQEYNRIRSLDESGIKKKLKEKREEIKTFEELISFLADIKYYYNTGYGNAIKSVGEALLAIGDFFTKEFGMTGTQSDAVGFEFERGWY